MEEWDQTSILPGNLPVFVGNSAFGSRLPTLKRRLADAQERLRPECPSSIDRLQLFARLEAHRLARRNGNFRPSTRVAPDSGLARAYVKHSKAPQLNAIALGERLLHALKNGFDRQLSLGLGNTSFVDHFVDDVELDHERLPVEECRLSTKWLML